MGMVLLASDLDNTLLFSRRHRRPGDICVERLDGEEQGFVTPRVWETLGTLPENLCLVPVTTRSVAQYRRIQWPGAPALAAAANGGVLLREGQPDPAWGAEFLARSAACQGEFWRLERALEGQDWCLRHRMVDGLYLFAVCQEGAEPMAWAEAARGDLTAARTGRKLYFFPPELHKGAAAERLRGLLRPALLVCAGDSPLDLPMLALADRALVPSAELAGGLPPGRAEVCPAGERFSEFVLRRALSLAAECAAGGRRG